MKHASLAAAAIVALAAANSASAAPIAPGGNVSYNILGTASVYQIFGHSGSFNDAASNAADTTFTAGSGLVFTVTASGLIDCCGGNSPTGLPDGIGGGTAIGGINGLSDISGNYHIPLTGVFTSNTDPFGNVAPAALAAFDATNPGSVSPGLNQVFYIGDGRAGLNDGAAGLLSFFAPSGATHLWLGIIDGSGFFSQSGYYADNPGSFDVEVSLTQLRQPGPDGVPEPFTLSLFGAGLAGAAALRRKNRSR